jgi:hypothetical protein
MPVFLCLSMNLLDLFAQDNVDSFAFFCHSSLSLMPSAENFPLTNDIMHSAIKKES